VTCQPVCEPRDGWALPNVIAKCKSLLFKRIQLAGVKDSLLSEHMRIHDLHGTLENPPKAKRITSKTAHLRQYATEMANVANLT